MNESSFWEKLGENEWVLSVNCEESGDLAVSGTETWQFTERDLQGFKKNYIRYNVYFYLLKCLSNGVLYQKNIRIILEGKATCRRHINTLKTGSGKSLTKGQRLLANQHKILLSFFGDLYGDDMLPFL
jgi:hypothetical protein